MILACDCGTSGVRSVIVDSTFKLLAQSYSELDSIYPQEGWVEQDPEQIWTVALESLKACTKQVNPASITGFALTNQRETTILWDKSTGEPVYNAIVWQCRRTLDYCQRIKKFSGFVKEKTGLVLDPYFSATKIRWILDHVPAAKSALEKGNLLFGTVDSWIIWRLTQGGVHATEPSNAARTCLYNIHDRGYDPDLCDLFDVPIEILPEVVPSGGSFGRIHPSILGHDIPLLAVLGDQQSALFAQTVGQKATFKNTYGTGLFVVLPTQEQAPQMESLLTTVAWQYHNHFHYAVEGSIFTGGSLLKWCQGCGLLDDVADSAQLARSVAPIKELYLVPALNGLGAPYWDPTAKAVLSGLANGMSAAHIVRAALEALAYQTRDVVAAFQEKMPDLEFNTLRVDGGAAQNEFLMQFQADILNMQCVRPSQLETTVLGVAALAGIMAGDWTEKDVARFFAADVTYYPQMDELDRDQLYQGWLLAVKRAQLKG